MCAKDSRLGPYNICKYGLFAQLQSNHLASTAWSKGGIVKLHVPLVMLCNLMSTSAQAQHRECTRVRICSNFGNAIKPIFIDLQSINFSHTVNDEGEQFCGFFHYHLHTFIVFELYKTAVSGSMKALHSSREFFLKLSLASILRNGR